MHHAPYPQRRLRRLRRTPWLRALNQETRLDVSNLIWPLFVIDGHEPEQIASMPGVQRWPVQNIVEQATLASELGIPAVALFPCIDGRLKTPEGQEALREDNLVCRTVIAVKQALADRIGVICDVALDPYTSHGHDGVLRDGDVDNDATIAILTRQACVLAQAGCDVLAPSDMMDGRVGAIRAALDAAGFADRAILSYAAKYASAFYGPFRDAVGSKAQLGQSGKQTYQMNPANALEALHEVAMDLQEGADMVMVKPAMPYLDIVRAVSERFEVPTFAYQVSGEYAMLEAASAQGWLDRRAVILEALLSIRRAGAQAILTYHALEVARWLRES